jgi:uncharacterized protein (TIGR02058 family)
MDEERKRFIVEIGTGIDIYGEDATKAACRAVKDAISRSCLCGLLEILALPNLEDVFVDILVATPKADQGDLNQVMAEVPIGRNTAHAVDGEMIAQGLYVSRFAPPMRSNYGRQCCRHRLHQTMRFRQQTWKGGG